MDVLIRPAKSLAGTVRLPGDKSISHRYAMLAALAPGTTRLQNYATGADCGSTLACIEALGCGVDRPGKEEPAEVRIKGLGAKLHAPGQPLDCGNSGSTMRMLAGILAAQDFTSELRGDASLSRRPMARIIEPLSKMGAHIRGSDGGRPPLSIRGTRLQGIAYTLPVASAQVKTSLLFAGLLAQGETKIEEPVRTRDHGELAVRAFGATVTRGRNSVSIAGGQKLSPIEARIPGDISSAAFFLCGAALLPDSELLFEDVLMNPTRAALLDVLAAAGARISVLHVEDRRGELAGTLRVQHGNLQGAKIGGATVAALIDELPVLAAIAPFTEEGVEIRDAAELRVKESDRLAAVAANLRAMGAEVEERPDGLRVPGRQRLHGAELSSFDDHRIAMAFAIAALHAEGESLLKHADCARISFPDFFSTLEQLAVR